jgi:transglutaminase-like putative cysteine protease
MHTALIESLLEYEVASPAHFLFNIETAFHDGHHVVEERLTITPSMKVRNFCDERSGNRFIRLDAPKGRLSVNYRAKRGTASGGRPPAPGRNAGDRRARRRAALPDAQPLLRVRRDEPRGAAALRPAAARHRPGSRHRKLDSRVDRLPARFSNSTTTAQEVFVQRAGVCRDFAHLGITMCRALNIPARLVVGYVHFEEPPQDFHAVFEAWLDGRWVIFDPTRMAPIDRLVRVGTGRDAKDVAFATIFGDVQMTRKELTVDEGDIPPLPPGGAQAHPVLTVVSA